MEEVVIHVIREMSTGLSVMIALSLLFIFPICTLVFVQILELRKEIRELKDKLHIKNDEVAGDESTDESNIQSKMDSDKK